MSEWVQWVAGVVGSLLVTFVTGHTLYRRKQVDARLQKLEDVKADNDHVEKKLGVLEKSLHEHSEEQRRAASDNVKAHQRIYDKLGEASDRMDKTAIRLAEVVGELREHNRRASR